MKPIHIRASLLLIAFFSSITLLYGQKYKSESSYISFFSDAPMEDIKAENPNSKSAIDLETGEIAFSVPIKSFTFEKSLMQEHFNENYLESEKYPNATFSGKLIGFDPSKVGWQPATAKGRMTIHGVENEITCDGRLNINGNDVQIEAIFPVQVADYKIKIPKVVFYNIAETVEVTVKISYVKIN
jgi:polyisoprenoid-binding protein YceI